MRMIPRTLTTLTIVAASLLAGAPADATTEHLTPVTFVAVHDNIPRTANLYNTDPAGIEYRQGLGTTYEHPELVCPKNDHYRLTWKDIPRGPAYKLTPGECLRPGPGPVWVELWHAARPTVHFQSVEEGIPASMDLYNTRQDGSTYRQRIGTDRTDAVQVCPKNDRFRLGWSTKSQIPGREDGVRVHVLRIGECLKPIEGLYVVQVYRAPVSGRAS